MNTNYGPFRLHRSARFLFIPRPRGRSIGSVPINEQSAPSSPRFSSSTLRFFSLYSSPVSLFFPPVSFVFGKVFLRTYPRSRNVLGTFSRYENCTYEISSKVSSVRGANSRICELTCILIERYQSLSYDQRQNNCVYALSSVSLLFFFSEHQYQVYELQKIKDSTKSNCIFCFAM